MASDSSSVLQLDAALLSMQTKLANAPHDICEMLSMYSVWQYVVSFMLVAVIFDQGE